jgi:hypothetical protein
MDFLLINSLNGGLRAIEMNGKNVAICPSTTAKVDLPRKNSLHYCAVARLRGCAVARLRGCAVARF